MKKTFTRILWEQLNCHCEERSKRTTRQFCQTMSLAMTKNAAFTMAARLSRFHNGLVGLRSAFTMAEILLSLTIIGVVAAITLPSLTGNINERTWNTQRKALYARFSQAIALMPSLNGYGTLTEDASGSVTEDTAAETFITAGLSKVLKINNICDNDHLEDCGIVTSLTTLNGSKISTPMTLGELNISMTDMDFVGGHSIYGSYRYTYSQIDTKAAAFETANGESILTYYSPTCIAKVNASQSIKVQRATCANFVYDLNGNKGPNTIGKDMGVITVLYPSDSIVVAPYPHMQNAKVGVTQQEALKACPEQDPEYRIPNLEELASIYVNRELFGISSDGGHSNIYLWSSTLYPDDPSRAYRLNQSGSIGAEDRSMTSTSVRCVKR